MSRPKLGATMRRTFLPNAVRATPKEVPVRDAVAVIMPPRAMSTGPSVSAVTDSRLPVPGAAGLGQAREMSGPVVDGALVDRTSRAAPSSAGVITGRGGAGIRHGASPIARNRDLGNPNVPTTSAPLHRFEESPAARNSRLYKRLPDVGGHAPWQGMTFARGGGVPTHPLPVNAHVAPPHPADVASGAVNPRGIRSAVARARRELKRPVTLRPGLGGLDVAMGVRPVPDTPSGRREEIRDVRPRRLRGAMSQHQTVPESSVRGQAEAGAASDFSPPAAPATTQQPNAVTASGMTLDASAPPAAQAGVRTPAPGDVDKQAGPSLPRWALPVAAVLALVLFAHKS